METGRFPHLRVWRRGMAVVFVLALALGALMPSAVSANVPTAGPAVVYFPTTGHNVSGDFLQFWHDNGGADRIGNPISEEVRDGKIAKQYFERGMIEYNPTGGISFGRIGADMAAGRLDAPFMPISRGEFGADRADRRFFPQTGHGISGTFATYWQQNGDLTTFGFPLSEPFKEAVGEKKEVVLVQYFERARFELVKGADGKENVRLGNLGRELVAARDLGLGPAPKDAAAQDYSPAIWPKWIDVNLKTQHLMAYEGNTVVQQFDITSGMPGHDTPTGVFQIFLKKPDERMKGDIGLPTAYDIAHVPWTMYFAGGGYAIHGAPWRAVYGPGTQAGGSHGCVNSPVDQVKVLYQWAPLGTTVIVHF
jgi:hypothetical protein